jgi:nitrogen regulatory protein P-II 1
VKKIEAFIRHEALEGIHDRLAAMGLPSMSVTETKGSGRQKGFTESYRGARSTIFLRPKLKLEIAVDDVDLERTLDVILELAHTGQPGDGKIFIYDIEEAIRVRTGERGPIVLESHEDDGRHRPDF